MQCCSFVTCANRSSPSDTGTAMSEPLLIKLPVKCGSKSFHAIVDLRPPEPSSDDRPPSPSPGQDDAPPDGEKVLRTVGELRTFIASEGGYEHGSKLKLIFRGKYIGEDPDEPLSNYQFKKSDKLMVVGGKPAGKSPADNAGMRALIDYERKHFGHLKTTIDTITTDIAELERNFLQGDMLAEMISRVDKRLKLYTETALRHLEGLDALHIYPEPAAEEQCQRNREKRKCLVHEVQQLMSQNDRLAIRLEQYVNQLAIENRDEAPIVELQSTKRGDGTDDNQTVRKESQ